MTRRIALYSDVHGNTAALHAVHRQMQDEQLTERYCLGDLVGLGPCPNEAALQVRGYGDPALRGNYDRAIALHLNSPGSDFATPQEALDGAESYAFTVSSVTPEVARYLNELPLEIRIEEQGARLLLCHGTPRLVSGVVGPDDMHGHITGLIREANADVVCAGHTHVPFHRSLPMLGGVMHWVNVGSVGRPRDGDARASWVELVLGSHADVVSAAPTDMACRRVGDSEMWLGVVVHRVAYDVDSVVREMEAKGLPHTLAIGLRTGLEEHHALLHERDASEVEAATAGMPASETMLVCGHPLAECACMYDERVAAYDALARMYRGDVNEASAAARSLRIAMRGWKVSRHVDETAIAEAFEGADRAFRTAAGREAFEVERERLFGLRAGFDPFAHVLSPRESTYLSGDVREHLSAIEGIYAEGSFTPPEISPGIQVADHVSTELSFMAHCLRGAASGDGRALARGRRFFTGHLAEWGVLFAVVVAQEAAEPVMRYAGLSLDKHLTCEGSIFRHAATAPEPDAPQAASGRHGPDEPGSGGVISFMSRRR